MNPEEGFSWHNILVTSLNWFNAGCDDQDDRQAVCEADIKAYEWAPI